MSVTVAIIVWACLVYYQRWREWDRATAFFASLPGALSMVILLASSSGADMRRVTISQCVRLFFSCRLASGHRLHFSSHRHGGYNAGAGNVFEITVLVVAQRPRAWGSNP